MSRDPEVRPLEILVVNWLDRENPRAGGAEEHLHQVFGRLAARGHRVTLLVSGWPGCAPRAALDGLEVHRTGRRYTFSIAAPRYYRRHLAARRFDVVVEDLNKIPIFCRFWTRDRVALLVHHLFGATAFRAAPLPVAMLTWVLERAVPLVFRRTPGVVVSESTRGDLARRGLRPELLEVIPNGIDLGWYTPVEGARAERPTLFFVGRLKRYKRVDLVLRALALLLARGRDVDLWVAGGGDRRSALEQEARRLGIEERVRFLGVVSEEEKRSRLRSAWLHVLTSAKEGWGISNLEAAACGTPSVASDAPGLRESVVHGETGLLVPHGDVEALADALDALLGDGQRRAEMGRRARAFAEGFSWDATALSFERWLLRVVAETGVD